MTAECWHCGARNKATSPLCFQCGAEIGARLASVTKKGMAVTDVLNGPVAAFENWDSPPLGMVLVATASLGDDRDQ